MWRLALSSGLSKNIYHKLFYFTYGSPSFYQDFIKSITNGFYTGVDIAFYFDSAMTFGLGYKYDKTYASTSRVGLSINAENDPVTAGSMHKCITYGFTGPAFCSRISFLKRNVLYWSTAIGCVYFNEHTLSSNDSLSRNYHIKSRNLGISWDVGYDYRISSRWAVGIQATLLGAAFFSYRLYENNQVKDLSFGDEKEPSLSSVNIGIGIRYSF